MNKPRIRQVIYVYEDGTSMTIDIPRYQVDSPVPDVPVQPVESIYNTCPKCGLGLSGVMGYCCPQPKCPTGLGGSWC